MAASKLRERLHTGNKHVLCCNYARRNDFNFVATAERLACSPGSK